MLSIFSKTAFCLLLLLYTYLGTVEIPSNVAASFNDLIAHALGYVVLMCAAVFAFPIRQWFLRLALACFAYSILIECIQYFLPYRSFSLLDILANGSGVLFGLFVANFCWPVIRRMHQLPD